MAVRSVVVRASTNAAPARCSKRPRPDHTNSNGNTKHHQQCSAMLVLSVVVSGSGVTFVFKQRLALGLKTKNSRARHGKCTPVQSGAGKKLSGTKTRFSNFTSFARERTKQITEDFLREHGIEPQWK